MIVAPDLDLDFSNATTPSGSVMRTAHFGAKFKRAPVTTKWPESEYNKMSMCLQGNVRQNYD